MRSSQFVFRVVAVAVLGVAAGCAPPLRTTSQPAVKTTRGATQQPAGREARKAEDTFDANLVPGRIHFVQPNETLYSLAERYYGHGKHWRRILAANRHRVMNATDLPVGMRLIIP